MSVDAQLELINTLFPDAAVLSVDQLAQVLGRFGRGGYEQTRRELDRGTLLPGLRKLNDRWLIPKLSVAELLAGLIVKPDALEERPRIRRRTAASDTVRPHPHATTQRHGGRRRSGNGLMRQEYVTHLKLSLPDTGQLLDVSDHEEIRAFWLDVLELLPSIPTAQPD